MKVLSRFFILSLLMGGISSISVAQEKPTIPINTVVERVQNYFTVYPVEKVHVHFDKPYYAVGDTLWFKTYLNRNLAEYDPSKIVYMEVLNSRDSLVQTLRVPLEDGGGRGQLILDPQYWSQDNYRFRAYTKWMMNFDNDYFFNKVVPIGDAINKKLGAVVNFAPENNRTRATLQFRDRSGALLGKRKLTWEANDGWDAFDKGRGETDDMGRVTITLSAKNRELMKTGRLVINLDNEGDKLVGQYSLAEAFSDADVQFFPEGGELIAGLSKKIAFKALGSDGKGLKVAGKVIDGKKNEVATFDDLGLGMGFFSLTPVSGETYHAVVTFENGQEKTYDLPAVADEGVSIVQVKQDDASIQLGVVTSDAHYEALKDKSFYIIGQSNGHLVYAAQASMKSSSILVKVPKENLPNGVVQFTLMTQDGGLVSERLVFHDSNSELLTIDLATDKTAYTSKDKVTLDIAVTNPIGQFEGNYSVAVVDEQKVPFDDDQELSIISNLLLTSDLRGFVEKPNYYFNPANENRVEALDALMMTQGFRRFEYDELLAEKYPEVLFLPEQGISLSGILRQNTGRPQPNAGLLLSIPSAGIKKDVYTDAQGRFIFEDLVFPDSAKVTVNARGNDNFRSLVINMDQTYFPSADQGSMYRGGYVQNMDERLKPYLDNSRDEFRTSILIDEVVVTRSAVKQQTSRDFPSLTGLSMPEHRLDQSRLGGCTVLTMCLNTVLTGITFDTNLQRYFVTRNYNAGSRVPVQFFLNGMPIDEPSLNSINPPDIEAIEIFLRDDLGTVSRQYQNDGVVSIITKKESTEKRPRMSLAEIEAMMPKSNVIDMFPLGYVRERVFYAPKYETDESKNAADYRSTIYWNPNVRPDESGHISLEYYNGDANGSYRVIVEGMDQTGMFGRQVLRYNVR